MSPWLHGHVFPVGLDAYPNCRSPRGQTGKLNHKLWSCCPRTVSAMTSVYVYRNFQKILRNLRGYLCVVRLEWVRGEGFYFHFLPFSWLEFSTLCRLLL